MIISIFILFFLSIGFVCANENITDENPIAEDISHSDIGEGPVTEDIENTDNSSQVSEEIPSKIDTKNVAAFYKDNSQLVSYLKDTNNQPIANKTVSIGINGKTYNRITDLNGRFVLNINLKPNTYLATISFTGDGTYASSNATSIVKVYKAPLTIETKNYRTYWESDLFFKAKVINRVTKNPVKGVGVTFYVYENNRYRAYYATTDANGVVHLKKNFKVGSYRVVTSIRNNKDTNSKASRATLTVMPTAEMGCSSLYVQVSNYEAVAGFRRDATNAKTLNIVTFKLNGKTAVKQYKTNSYFFHMVTTADGWMFATGGRDNANINHAIENLAGKMVKSGKIDKSSLLKIQRYEKTLGIGHFSIKAPKGNYAIVWASGIVTGKLNPGEYIDVPNSRSYFRQGTWAKYNNDPAKAAIKIAATDSFGVNRRDVTAFHWKSTTIEGKTTSTLRVYAANDNGRLVGRSTAYLKDDIMFNGKFFSKNKLPQTPSSMLVGVVNFGSIDNLIKIQTIVLAPKVVMTENQSKTFNILVRNKITKNPISNLYLKIKIDNKVYTVITNSRGFGIFNVKFLKVGTYNPIIYSGSINYFVSVKSTIVVNKAPIPANTNISNGNASS